ncbi:MAG: acetate kinase [Oscillospiraceae bacterium]|nr:acetate kinase [Oscillospiraceae bacterium]
MYVLVINSGSSSLKYQLLDMSKNELLAKGVCEKIGSGGMFSYQAGNIKIKEKPMEIATHEDAIRIAMETLTDAVAGILKDIRQIGAVGHRIVHGGENFIKPVIVSRGVLEEMKKNTILAPLHNPPAEKGVEACMKLLPEIPHVAVFDTSFYTSIPDYAYVYPIPYKYYEKHKIRRYGFHGTSHNYVTGRAAEFIGRDIKQIKIVSCHLGNGSSITAVKNGRSVDTTMGFTPLEGLMMGTRSGTIDPSIITFLMREENLSPKQMEDILNKKSGFGGVSGKYTDWRDICSASENGEQRAMLVQKIISAQIKKYIGGFAAVMGGVDVLIFTAGIGENSCDMRALATDGLEFLGIKINRELNENMPLGVNVDLSASDAMVKTLVIPTNEELMIANETVNIIKS